MISAAIYIYSLRQLAKNYVFYIIAFGVIVLMPLSTIIDKTALNTQLDLVSSYPCALLFGLSLIVSQNIVSGNFAQGASDYLPLILSRPITRAQYVITKLFALMTVVVCVSLLQATMLFAIGDAYTHHWTNSLIICSVIQRVIDSISVCVALLLVSLLPTRQLFGFGVIVLELVGLSHLALDFDMYTPPTASALHGALAHTGISAWLNQYLFPLVTVSDFSSLKQLTFTLMTQLADLIAPRFFVFDFLTNTNFDLCPLIIYLMNLSIGLILSLLLLNTRDINYAAE